MWLSCGEQQNNDVWLHNEKGTYSIDLLEHKFLEQNYDDQFGKVLYTVSLVLR